MYEVGGVRSGDRVLLVAESSYDSFLSMMTFGLMNVGNIFTFYYRYGRVIRNFKSMPRALPTFSKKTLKIESRISSPPLLTSVKSLTSYTFPESKRAFNCLGKETSRI